MRGVQRRGSRLPACLLASALVSIWLAAWLFALPVVTKIRMDTLISKRAEQAGRLAYANRFRPALSDIDKLTAVRHYNRDLARLPLWKRVNDFNGRDDQRYQSLLNILGDGTMGRISIPKINVNAPIKHGVDTIVLDDSVGHLHGTSLPVGGKNTHTALTAHSNLPYANLFTDLYLLKKGDHINIQVLGVWFTYRVVSLSVHSPDDITPIFTINPQRDALTLITCVPPDNTQRLFVYAQRDDSALPPREHTYRVPWTDIALLSLITTLGTIMSLPIILTLTPQRKQHIQAKHAIL